MTGSHPRTWFVTGAASGLGAALVDAVLARGENVVAGVRSSAALDPVARRFPDQLLVTQLDVTRADERELAIEEAARHFGRIDVLVNNAGIGLIGALEETPEADLRALMEVNFFGAFDLIRRALPHLRAQGGGAIVNVSSIAAIKPRAGYAAYAASKFALDGMSEALALELKPFGIKVIVAQPGALATDFAKRSIAFTPEMPEYEESVGTVRTLVRESSSRSWGSPAQAAEAIYRATNADTCASRLPLGTDATAALQQSMESRREDVKAWEQLGIDLSLRN